ncbi:hypothetical protein HAX54_003110 [Datura stramonium]|uniref:CSD domain-containing protein n=1 Tax=Datura stramonium TaxID=4076 RepID=A0ABS8RWP8_DATST|nr:hypothetical protein [Datura stramonium]
MASESGRRIKGYVKWFSDQKGFGFVTPDDGGDDLFVHQSGIRSEGFRSLSEGEPVEFEVESGDDGRSKAVNVTGPDGAPVKGSRGGGGGGDRYGGGGYGGGGSRYGGGDGGYGGGGRDTRTQFRWGKRVLDDLYDVLDLDLARIELT